MVRCGRVGMTMMELLIALTVLGMVLTGAYSLVNLVMARYQMSRDHYVAATICLSRIERARSIPYANLPLDAESQSVVDDYGNPSPNGRFQRTTTVVTDSPVAGMTQMTVQTLICSCSHWGWRSHLHPMHIGKYVCHFTTDGENMSYLFTEYLQ